MDKYKATGLRERLAALEGWRWHIIPDHIWDKRMSRHSGGYPGSREFWVPQDGRTQNVHDDPPDYLNDWNALKRLEAKVMDGGEIHYIGALLEACGIVYSADAASAATGIVKAKPKQIAEAVLEMLE